MTVLLNNLECKTCTILVLYVGAWVADVELSDNDTLPSGKVTLTIGGAVYPGRIDDTFTGTLETRKFARIVGGNGGWGAVVDGDHYHDPNGVTSTAVYNATAKLVGETINDPTPTVLGSDWARLEGPASRVFGDANWYVNPTDGVTTVAAWPSISPPDDILVAEYNPIAQTVVAHSASLILPGTVITDDRFGTVTVRDVEQTFDSKGSTALLSVSANPVSRLTDTLSVLVRELGQTAQIRTYVYRFVLSNPDGTLALQGITPGAPDLNPISQWTGLSGAQSRIAPSTIIVVGFAGNDYSTPYIVSFNPLGHPTEIDLGGGANFLVPAPWASGLASALSKMAASLITAGVGPLAPLAAIGTALQTALGLLPPPATVITKAT